MGRAQQVWCLNYWNFFLFQEPILNIDFAPTFIDIAGGKIPDNIDGESFKPLLKNESKHGNKGNWILLNLYKQDKIRCLDWRTPCGKVWLLSVTINVIAIFEGRL